MTEPDWIFAYGSLLWNPGFAPAEARLARLEGWRRGFFMRSVHFRGTPERAGLVLALNSGGACTGLALRIPPEARETVLRDLRARELVTDAYLEKTVQVQLDDGSYVAALTYVIARDGAQYCDLPLEEQAQIIAHAVGQAGPNRAYLYATADHLAGLGIADPDLAWLAERVRAIAAAPL